MKQPPNAFLKIMKTLEEQPASGSIFRQVSDCCISLPEHGSFRFLPRGREKQLSEKDLVCLCTFKATQLKETKTEPETKRQAVKCGQVAKSPKRNASTKTVWQITSRPSKAGGEV